MANKKFSAAEVKAAHQKKYDEAKDKLISQIKVFIETGETPPWIKPWRSLGPMRNPVTGTTYKGMNIMHLGNTIFGDPRWLTVPNGNKLGGRLKKGSKATTIFSAHPWIKKVADEDTGEEKIVVKKRPPKPINVFNVEQFEGLDLPELIEAKEVEGIPQIDEFMSNLPLNGGVNYGSNRAFYAPGADHICMPDKRQFENIDSYYSVFFHELVHSTGHEARLNRNMGSMKGSPAYAFEELVAEFGAAFLCAEFGVNGHSAHPQYIRGWLKELFDDTDELMKAASLACQAAEFVRSEYFGLGSSYKEAS